MRFPPPRFGWVLVTAWAAQRGCASTSPQIPSPEPAVLTFPSGYGMDSFQVLEPEAESSSASRLNHDRVDKNGLIPSPTGGYTLTNQVLVVSDQIGLLHELVLAVDPQAEVLVFPINGVHLVQTTSVSMGIEMALCSRDARSRDTPNAMTITPTAMAA